MMEQIIKGKANPEQHAQYVSDQFNPNYIMDSDLRKVEEP
jgi:hypothetical protein